MGALHGTSEPVQWSSRLVVKSATMWAGSCALKSMHGYVSAFKDRHLLSEGRKALTD